MPDPPMPSVRLDNAAVWDAVHPRLESLSSGASSLSGRGYWISRMPPRSRRLPVGRGTSSGTSALTLSLKAAPIAREQWWPCRRTPTSPRSKPSCSLRTRSCGGGSRRGYLLDLEASKGFRSDAVVPVHLYGLPVDMEALNRMASHQGWWVLEDCSQAHGATLGPRPVGSFRDAGAFSAYPTKNLGAWGEPGSSQALIPSSNTGSEHYDTMGKRNKRPRGNRRHGPTRQSAGTRADREAQVAPTRGRSPAPGRLVVSGGPDRPRVDATRGPRDPHACVSSVRDPGSAQRSGP